MMRRMGGGAGFTLGGHWKKGVMWSVGNMEKIGNGWGWGWGGVNAALPCDGSSSVPLTGNFPLYFPPPQEAETAQETQCSGGFPARRRTAFSTFSTFSTFTHDSVPGSSRQLCGAPGPDLETIQARVSLQTREGL